MKKTRFFYGKKVLLAVLLAWLALLNEAVALNISRGNTQEETSEEQTKGQREETSQKQTEGQSEAASQKQMEGQSEAASQKQREGEREAASQNQAESQNEAASDNQTEGQSKSASEDQVNAQSEAVSKEQIPAQASSLEEPYIRVLLMDTDYQAYEHPSVTVCCGGETTTYTPDSAGLVDGPVVLDGGEAGIEITSISRQEGSPVYQGIVEIHKGDTGLYLINELPLETYLEAVVPSEMPSSYAKEALMAQAICARTYAWKQMEEKRLEEYGADVDDSVNYQVYQNIAPKEETTAAVRETAGQVLCQNGELIEAYYFSTSAGATSTDEIWGAEEAAAYLKSVECTFDSEEPWSKWEVTLPWENVQAKAQALSGGSGALVNLEIVRKNQSGAVTTLKVITEDGAYEVNEEYAIREFLSPSGCTITERDGSQTTGGKLLPSAYFTMEVLPGNGISIMGGGYGHGVGMSQNAANQMAEEGYTCEEILDYFFKDVQITRKE
ncbi:SpoIID/LytB domain-containing protein [Blautia schinkii]|nr:SpoIID/LytB domain-containing protein [Blautia schinkii]